MLQSVLQSRPLPKRYLCTANIALIRSSSLSRGFQIHSIQTDSNRDIKDGLRCPVQFSTDIPLLVLNIRGVFTEKLWRPRACMRRANQTQWNCLWHRYKYWPSLKINQWDRNGGSVMRSRPTNAFCSVLRHFCYPSVGSNYAPDQNSILANLSL